MSAAKPVVSAAGGVGEAEVARQEVRQRCARTRNNPLRNGRVELLTLQSLQRCRRAYNKTGEVLASPVHQELFFRRLSGWLC